jgi:sugar lactone lactonase YvrE
MKRSTSRVTFALLMALALIAPVVPMTSRAQEATPAAGMQTVVDGIANPRGFTWGADGTMFLAVSGTGGDNPGPEGSPFSGGDTASVAVVRDGAVTSLAPGLPSSVWRDIDWVWGVMDVAILGDQLYALVGGGGAVHGNPDRPSGIYRINADETATVVADLGTWVDENPVADTPPEGAPNNGSFFAMVPVGETLWVVESVNGQVLQVQVTSTGAVTRIADLSEGHLVPSGIVAAPEGGAYVGYLTSAPYPVGAAKIAHIAPDGTVEDVWTGLTAVTGLTLGPDGTLYAAELSAEISDAEPFFTANTGRILRQTGPDSAEAIVSGLDMPVAARIGPDGALYVSTPAFGGDEDVGRVIRIELDSVAAANSEGRATPVS